MSVSQTQLDNDFRQACSLGNINEVMKLYDAGKVSDIDCQEEYELYTGLHLACEQTRYNIVKYLLKCGANIDKLNKFNETPLIVLLKPTKVAKKISDIIKIIEILLTYNCNVSLGNMDDTKHKFYPKAIHLACILGDTKVLRMLLDYKADLVKDMDKINRLPIHYAAQYNNVLCIQELLNYNSELEPCDVNGYTPFHVACDNERGSLDAIQMLLDQGCHMYKETNDGDRGIHLACRHKVKTIVPVVEFLISQGADINKKDSKGRDVKNYYVKQNNLIKYSIKNATKNWENGTLNNNKKLGFGQSFEILDLKGDKFYTGKGYQLLKNHKKLEGTFMCYEHGITFEYKKGWLSKQTIHEFYQYNTNITCDASNPKVLSVKISQQMEVKTDEKVNSDNDTKSEDDVKLLYIYCRSKEIQERIYKEISVMYPTYTISNEINAFMDEIGGEDGVIKKWTDLQLNIAKLNGFQLQLDKLKANNNDNSNDNEINKLINDINNLNLINQESITSIHDIYNKANTILNDKIIPMINDLNRNINDMMSKNIHWKIIGNEKTALKKVKGWETQLNDIKSALNDAVNMYPK